MGKKASKKSSSETKLLGAWGMNGTLLTVLGAPPVSLRTDRFVTSSVLYRQHSGRTAENFANTFPTKHTTPYKCFLTRYCLNVANSKTSHLSSV